MIDLVIACIKMIIAILPFLVLCLESARINMDEADRSKQFLMPIIAVVYSLVLMFFMDSVNNWLLMFIQGIPVWLESLAARLPENGSAVFVGAGNMALKLFTSLNMGFWIFFISNSIIMAVYLAIKKISLTVMKKIFAGESSLHKKIAGEFYEYFPEKSKWCIKESYVQTREMLKVFYYSAIVLSIILVLISKSFYWAGLFKTVFYPVFGIIIVGELYFYLSGATKKEYAQDILGEDEDAYRTVNYSLLRKFLRNLFGDKLLSENTSINNMSCDDAVNDDIIRGLEKSEDPNINNFSLYIKRMNKAGENIDLNYVYSAVDLMNGKSILFNNPFYYDLIPYAFYPMNRVLLSHKKVLVVLGRHAIEEDVKKWIQDGIRAVTNIPFLWNTEILTDKNNSEADTDIGIITRSDVLNIKLHNANAEFLENVEFIVILEPSKLISTAQIGLNLIIKHCFSTQEKNITYCLCDKNCDGLIDAMSHILMTSITEVSATNKHMGRSSYMCWDADADYLHHRIVPNISRYLGLGTELSYAALKNQVSKTQWYGGDAFPVFDMRWIDKQYYYELMKYAGLPLSQEVMDEKFLTTSSFWNAKTDKYNYFTVEDEIFNMFEVLRNFATRSKEQGFINVISSDYLLRDYMADNASIFETDAKAIPNIVADYVRSNRNTVMRLILMMSTFAVGTDTLKNELSLIGIKVYNVKKQLWYEIYRCYADIKALNELSDDYITAVEETAGLTLKNFKATDRDIDIELLEEADIYNSKIGRIEHTFRITNSEFLDNCVSELKSAGYVAEDEKGDKYYLGAELCGHIYQKYLPGQFFTFSGKYYEMRYLTADNQVLVRRAADHITGRPMYRQIREYVLLGVKPSEQIGSRRDVSGTKIIHEYADINVNTCGYFRMEKYNDFTTAKEVLFEGEKSGIPKRKYYNKEILRIELANEKGLLSDNIRYTITTVLNEIFKTIFAENYHYIVAVTDESFNGKDGNHQPLTYSIKGNGCEIDKNSIYIIEDSQPDLGLMVAFERNWQRILEIIDDYLDWHIGALALSVNPPKEPQLPINFCAPKFDDKTQKKDVISVLKEKIKSMIKSKKLNEESSENDVKEVCDSEEVSITETPEDKNIYATEDEIEDKKGDFGRRPYYERYFLLFGNNCVPDNICIAETLDYLNAMGLSNNPLKQAREGKKVAKMVEENFHPKKTNSRYCDFCGVEIYGVEYETLSDGRDRCINCGRTAVKTVEEFRAIFEDVKRNMESSFGIKLNVGIKVEMVNSKTLHKRLHKAFVPTPNTDSRVLGVAISDKNGYTLMIENGSPRMSAMLTMAHELTHIWQYVNWNNKEICRQYGKDLQLEIYEGMAKWVEIQYAYLINEPAVAKREEIITSQRMDEYGRGFLRYLANYSFSLGTVITKKTPFMNVTMPLDMQYCGEISYSQPEHENTEDEVLDPEP